MCAGNFCNDLRGRPVAGGWVCRVCSGMQHDHPDCPKGHQIRRSRCLVYIPMLLAPTPTFGLLLKWVGTAVCSDLAEIGQFSHMHDNWNGKFGKFGVKIDVN